MRRFVSWGNGALLLVNVGLLTVLLIPWLSSGEPEPEKPVYEPGVLETLPAEEITFDPPMELGPQQFAIHFPVDMVEESELGMPTAEPLVFSTPSIPLNTIWSTSTELIVAPKFPLARASRFRFIVSPDLVSLDNRRVPDGTVFDYHTAPVRLLATTILKGDDGTSRIGLSFDLPVDLAHLNEQLTILDLEDRVIPYEIAMQQEDDGDVFVITLHPTPGTPDPVRVRLLFGLDLHSVDSDVTVGAPFERRVDFADTLRLEYLSADHEEIYLRFNRRIPLPSPDSIRIEPEVPFQIVRRWSGIKLVGKFAAGSNYTISLEQGFPGQGTARLLRPVTRTARTRDLRPQFRFTREGSVLSLHASPVLDVETVNVQRMRVSVRSVYPNNLVHFAKSNYWVEDHLLGPPTSREMDVSASQNTWSAQNVDLSEFLTEGTAGLHEIVIEDPEHKAGSLRRYLQVTDLGLTVRSAPGTVAVRVTGLADGRPVANARIRVLTETNQEIVHGDTDERGVAVLPWTRRQADWTPWLVVAEKEGDMAYVDLNHFGVSLAEGSVGGRPFLTSGLEAWVYPDRGVVRPGETIRATVAVRNSYGVAPANTDLQARWHGPDGRVLRTEVIRTSGSGMALLAFNTDLSAPTGPWRVDVLAKGSGSVIGSANLNVETFVPNRLEAAVEVVDELHFGETATIRVRANWLEGGPAASRPVSLRVRFDDGARTFDTWPDHSFDLGQHDQAPGARPLQKGVLGEDGTFEFTVHMPDEMDRQALTARFAVEVMDPSGRAVRVGDRALVSRVGSAVGVRADQRIVHVVDLDVDGNLTSSSEEGTYQLLWRHWNWELISDGNDRWRYRTTLVDREISRTQFNLQNGEARLDAGVLEKQWGGWYVASIDVNGVRAESDLSRRVQKPDRLRVTAPEMPVNAGEIAKVGVDAPFGGEALVTIEGNGVHSTHIVSIEPGGTTVDIPVPDSLKQPNVHAVFTLRAPQRTAGDTAPVWVVGGCSIRIAHPERALAVTMSAPNKVRPESDVTVNIDAPTAREAVVLLVDEGILQITGHRDPDPASWFLAQRALESRGADNGSALLERPRFQPDAEPGGDGGDGLIGPRLQNTTSDLIRTVALNSGLVQLDANGRGQVTLSLPPYEGRLRAIVITAGPAGTGGASAPVVVSGPIGLQVAVPRFVAPGDQFDLPVTVRNGLDEAATLDVVFDWIGDVRANNDVSALRIELEPQERSTNSVRVTAGSTTGVAGMRCTVRSGNEVRVVEELFKVRPAELFAVESSGIAIEGEKTIEIPVEWSSDFAVELTVAGSPNARLLPLLDALDRYPYGCVEQTTSIAFGTLACRNLYPLLDVDGGTRPDVASRIDASVDRLFSMQTASGGLGWWPDSRQEYAFGSVWAAEFLVTARQAGVQVPAKPLERLIKWIEEELHRSEEFSWRCYAASVLARAGRPMRPWLERLASEAVLYEDCARLAIAFAIYADEDAAKKVLEQASNADVARERSGMLRSARRALALELETRVVLNPRDAGIADLVMKLERELTSPEVLTTQEQARYLLALALYYRTLQQDGWCTDGVVLTSGGETTIAGEGTYRLELGTDRSFRVVTDGVMYANLRLSGFRSDTGDEAVEGLDLRRSVFDLETGEPVEHYVPGHMYEVHLSGMARIPQENLLLTDVLPGGLEPVNPRLAGQVDEDDDEPAFHDRLEIRDDRVLMFRTRTLAGVFTATYRVRAVFAGHYVQPPTMIESLYEPGIRVRLGGGQVVEVKNR